MKQLRHPNERYRLSLLPYDTMYDHVGLFLLGSDTTNTAEPEITDGCIQLTLHSNRLTNANPQGPQRVILGVGFTAGLCFIGWNLFRA